MKYDTFHTTLGVIVFIQHQENPGTFLVAESELKGNLFLRQ